MATGRDPQRTCIGCRGVFGKGEVVRVVAGPGGAVIDYREKLPGRAAYVCPRPACIHEAMTRERLSRALHTKVDAPGPGEFINRLEQAVIEKVSALLSMAARAGMLAAGASAVEDALEKGRAELLLFASDIAEGTRDKVGAGRTLPRRTVELFTRRELGSILGRELVGVVAVLEKGFADAVWSEMERLKGLRNQHR